MRRIVIKRRQLQHSSNNHTNPSPTTSPPGPTDMQLTPKESQPGRSCQLTQDTEAQEASAPRQGVMQRTPESVTKPTAACESECVCVSVRSRQLPHITKHTLGCG